MCLHGGPRVVQVRMYLYQDPYIYLHGRPRVVQVRMYMYSYPYPYLYLYPYPYPCPQLYTRFGSIRPCPCSYLYPSRIPTFNLPLTLIVVQMPGGVHTENGFEAMSPLVVVGQSTTGQKQHPKAPIKKPYPSSNHHLTLVFHSVTHSWTTPLILTMTWTISLA